MEQEDSKLNSQWLSSNPYIESPNPITFFFSNNSTLILSSNLQPDEIYSNLKYLFYRSVIPVKQDSNPILIYNIIHIIKSAKFES